MMRMSSAMSRTPYVRKYQLRVNGVTTPVDRRVNGKTAAVLQSCHPYLPLAVHGMR
jgi:hypothetical protein